MRQSKPKKLETITHGPFSADIRLDRQSGLFSCDYGADTFSNTSLVDVRKWAWQQLRTHSALKWHPIMEVSFSSVDDRVNNLKNCTNIRCHMERYYIAWTGEKWVQTPWVVMPPGTYLCSGPPSSEMNQDQHPMSDTDLMKQRIAHSQEFHVTGIELTEHLRFPIVSEEVLGGQRYYVRYTEENWATMLGLMEKIRELRGRIQDLLSCGEGWNVLSKIAQAKLLPAPESS
jgi:hypothetical protein